MTKEEWFESVAIFQMLEFSNISERKCRLFACACVRRIWDTLSDNQKKAIELAENFADDNAYLDELTTANINLSFTAFSPFSSSHYINEACWQASHVGVFSTMNYHAAHCCTNVFRVHYLENETERQADLLRHMVKYERIKHARN